MSYTKQTWQTGDIITAAKLNHMEDGISGGSGGGVLITTSVGGTLDKTWKEINDALLAGTNVFVATERSYEGEVYSHQMDLIDGLAHTLPNTYQISTKNTNFETYSENGFPAAQ